MANRDPGVTAKMGMIVTGKMSAAQQDEALGGLLPLF